MIPADFPEDPTWQPEPDMDVIRLEGLSALLPAVTFAGDPVRLGSILDGRFYVEALISTGGMGEVFRVRDRYRNNATRALKVIRSEFSFSSDFAERFQSEVSNLLSITHKNVCRAYDLGIDRSGGLPRLYYTMELVEGPTLAAYLAENRPLSPAKLEQLALGLIAGLEVSHARSVIHRDLKPSNIMLSSQEELVPVILDFGLALNLATRIPLAERAGTYDYMAPEQRLGGTITNRTDIYALGLILYDAAAKNPKTSVRDVSDHLMASTIETAPPDSTDHLSKGWARIILRCIEADPARRYTDVAAVRDAILWQHKLPRRIAIGLGCATAAGLAIGLRPVQPAGSQTTNKAAGEAYERGLLHSRRLVPDELRKSVAYFRRATTLDPGYALAWAALSEAYSRLGDYGGMLCREAFDLGQAAAYEAMRVGPSLAQSYAAMGLAVSIDPRIWTQAEPRFQRAAELDPGFSSTFQWYGGHLARLGRTKDAIHQLARAIAADPFSLPVSVVYGWMHYYDRQFGRAIACGEQTLDLDPNFLYGHVLLARCQVEAGRTAEAVRSCDNAARISVALSKSGKQSPVVLSTAASVFGRRGDTSKALEAARALEASRDGGEVIPVHYIASAYCEAHNHNKALDLIEKGLEDCDTGALYLRAYPPFDPIRNLPRYLRLVERLGYPPLEQRERV